jgi:hypothetical protein
MHESIPTKMPDDTVHIPRAWQLERTASDVLSRRKWTVHAVGHEAAEMIEQR